MKKFGTTLIIGNGCDLNLGMRTDYCSFFNELSQSGFFSKYNHIPLIKFIQEKGEKEKWFDFEAIIEEFASISEQAIYLKLSERLLLLLDKVIGLDGNCYNDISDYNKLSKISPEIQSIIDYSKKYTQPQFALDGNVRELCSKIKKALKKYIKEQRDSAKTGAELLRKELVSFLEKARITIDNPMAIWIIWAVMGIFDRGKKGLADGIIQSYANADGTYTFPPFQIVSFNYTDTILHIARLLEISCGMSLCLDTDKLGNSFYRIHGNLEDSIVFGIDDGASIPNAFLSLRKSQNIEIDAKRQFREILDNSERIVILGHTLYGIDFDYYEGFFRDNKNTEIVILYHNEEAKKEFQEVLEDRGVTAKIKYVQIGLSHSYASFCEDIANEQKKHFNIIRE